MVVSFTPATSEIFLAFLLIPHKAVTNMIQAAATVIGLLPSKIPISLAWLMTCTAALCVGTLRPRWLQYRVMRESFEEEVGGPFDPGAIVSRVFSIILKQAAIA